MQWDTMWARGNWARPTGVLAAIALFASAGVEAGCASSARDEHPRDDQAAHLEIGAAVPLEHQSAGVRLAISRCGEARPVVTRRVGFSAGSLDEFEGFGDTPVRLGKKHLFARSDFSLGPGCYRASAQVLDLHKQPIESCSVAKTPELPMGSKVSRSLLLVARCGDRPSDTPIVAGKLNFAPLLTDLKSHFNPDAGAYEVCARTFDADGDRTRVEWRARTRRGREVTPQNIRHGEQSGPRRTVCAQISASGEAVEVTAVARDGLYHVARGFLSNEAYRLYRHGVAAASRAEKTVRVPAQSPSGGLEAAVSAIEGWTYWIHRDGEVLSPTTDLSKARSGDRVQVEIQIAEGCEELEAEFLSLRGSTALDHASVRVVERDGGFLGAGSHVLWVDVPERPFALALVAQASGEHRVLDSSGVLEPEGAPSTLIGIAR